MLAALRSFLLLVLGTLRDLLPIIGVVAFFQIFVIQQPFPNLGEILTGVIMVMFGLALFLQGLQMGLFPLGEAMAGAFARKGNLTLLLLFGFGLGFGTTIAEPALIAVAATAADAVAEAGAIVDSEEVKENYALGLRYTVAVAVGFALVLGVLRILKGWPLHFLIIGGYLLVVLLSLLAPREIIGIAYDSGGVTTSTVTVPLVTALGIGLATVVRGRNPMLDGFGLIAFASLTPIAFVLVYGMVV